MSGVLWIKVDTGIFDNPKMLALRQEGEHRAIVLHLQGMAYSARQGLNGFIPNEAVLMLNHAEWMLNACLIDAKPMLNACPGDAKPMLDEAEADAKRAVLPLLKHEVWMLTTGGYTCHDWEDYQATSNEARARSEKARNAAQARWSKRNGHAPS